MRIDASTDPAGHAAAAIAEAIRHKEGPFHLALSGGRTPWAMCEILTAMNLDWSRVHIWQVDERVAPEAEQNWPNLRRSLVVSATFHPMPIDAPDADVRYAALLPLLDLVQLGLGADGHTASLVDPTDPPGSVALTGPYQGRRRLTLTLAPIRAAVGLIWLVTGAEKRPALARLLSGDRTIPAGRVDRADAVVYCDLAAAP